MIYDPEKLRSVLAAQGRRVDWLAEMTDYDPATISRFLNGSYPISDKFAKRAAGYLGVPVEMLLADAEAVPA